jgi:hypothetical protein
MPGGSATEKGKIYNPPRNVRSGSRGARFVGKMCKINKEPEPAFTNLTQARSVARSFG